MRSFLILPLSAALLGGCLTTQESPIYEQSTSYQGDLSTRHQYAGDTSATSTAVSPTSVSPTSVTYETAQPVFQPQPVPAQAYSAPATVMASSPTDSAYSAGEVSGTPGFMAMQQSMQEETVRAQTVQADTASAPAQSLPAAQYVNSAPLGAAGTPIAYDYSRNLVPIDTTTTGQSLPETSRILPRVGQNYTVQQGDTVYSLSRKTCVGVNVIQSMNGLSGDYAIKIGQSITLPTSVC